MATRHSWTPTGMVRDPSGSWVLASEARPVTISTARGCNPEEDVAPGLGSVPADGNLRIAIEEAIASLEAGMIAGAAYTLREAIAQAGRAAGVYSPETHQQDTPAEAEVKAQSLDLYVRSAGVRADGGTSNG